MFKVTKKWLEEKRACSSGYQWFLSQNETKLDKVLLALIKDNQWEWANWTIVRAFNRKQKLQYAIFAAKQVINIYEKKYPNNNTPRQAIEAAVAVLKNDTQENRDIALEKRIAAADYTAYAAAAAAAYAAAAAADYTAYTAAAAAAYAAAAADAAAAAAADAAAAAYAAAAAAAYAAAAAAAYTAAAAAAAADADAADAARKEMRLRIINYGISLLK